MSTLERLQTAAAEPASPIAHPWPGHAAPAAPGSWRQRAANFMFRLFTPTVDAVTLPNFGWLGPTLYRGAQPGRLGFQALRAMEVDTVINLRAESNDEARLVEDLGMRHLYFPLDPFSAPTHDQAMAFLYAATDPDLGRIYFHCYHGADRTGVLAACFRIAHDGWSLREATTELRAHGFHHAFQQPMLQYLRAFDEHWHTLPAAEQARVLRRA